MDAGALSPERERTTEAKPNDSRTPGEWISRYILHMLDGFPEKKLDYVLLTHFHGDHMGAVYPGIKTSESGAFKLTGITEVGEQIPFDKIIDRGWDYPDTVTDKNVRNYKHFVHWQVSENKVEHEQFLPGQNDQIVLVNNPQKYPGFVIQNIAANGVVWTGTGEATKNYFPPVENMKVSEIPNENMCSIAFRLSYGKFDYFNGGDIVSGGFHDWRNIEYPVGLVTGPVDVCETNHHAFFDAMSKAFLQAVRPRIFIIQAWSASHPSHSSIVRMMSDRTYPGPRDVFTTNMMDATHTVIGPFADNMKSRHGHVVLRVAPDGEQYTVYILDDSEESYKIKSVYGPYNSK